jgi:hypothetical protein
LKLQQTENRSVSTLSNRHYNDDILQLLIKLNNFKNWSYIWEDFSILYNQIQRKGKFIESCESPTTSNEMVNSIEYREKE